MDNINYKNAYKEVYIILQKLIEEDYNKIPKQVIQAIDKEKNDKYEFKLNDQLELRKQDLLPETRAILFNLFRDYLSEPWQREKIIKWQTADRRKNEKLKQKRYNNDVFVQQYKMSYKNREKQTEEEINYSNNNEQLVIYKENFFKKILNFLKKLFKL